MVGAEFLDIFGILAFIVVIIIGINLIKGEKLPTWLGYLILVIGIVGLISDSYMVIKTYLFGG